VSQNDKGGVIESMVISYMILPGDTFGLSRAYCVNGLGCLNMFYLGYDYELRPYELISVVCYLCMLCTSFVLGFGDYALSVWLFNPFVYIFSPRSEHYWWPAVLYLIIQFNQYVYMYFSFE